MDEDDVRGIGNTIFVRFYSTLCYLMLTSPRDDSGMFLVLVEDLQESIRLSCVGNRRVSADIDVYIWSHLRTSFLTEGNSANRKLIERAKRALT